MLTFILYFNCFFFVLVFGFWFFWGVGGGGGGGGFNSVTGFFWVLNAKSGLVFGRWIGFRLKDLGCGQKKNLCQHYWPSHATIKQHMKCHKPPAATSAASAAQTAPPPIFIFLKLLVQLFKLSWCWFYSPLLSAFRVLELV